MTVDQQTFNEMYLTIYFNECIIRECTVPDTFYKTPVCNMSLLKIIALLSEDIKKLKTADWSGSLPDLFFS